MPLPLPELSAVGRDTWDRAHAAHHLNEIERQVGLMEFHTARVGPTPDGCRLIDRICAQLQAMKQHEAEKEAA